MAIRGLDSAIPPRDISLTAAYGFGIRLWAGYFAGPNIYNGWQLADFQRVQAAGFSTLAFCSGLADPLQMKSQSVTWDVPICLDVEGGIRPDGPWVQGWLDASGSGLYGALGCHQSRQAPFHVLADYPGYDPGMSWPSDAQRPSAPVCGWQWQGTHAAFGASVDSSWWDDAFARLHGGSGGILTASEDSMLIQIGNGNAYVVDAAGKRLISASELFVWNRAGVNQTKVSQQEADAIPNVAAGSGAELTTLTFSGTGKLTP